MKPCISQHVSAVQRLPTQPLVHLIGRVTRKVPQKILICPLSKLKVLQQKKKNTEKVKKIKQIRTFYRLCVRICDGEESVLISSPTRTCSLPIKVDLLRLHQHLWAYLLMKIPHNLGLCAYKPNLLFDTHSKPDKVWLQTDL
jgi:hypothetical protein